MMRVVIMENRQEGHPDRQVISNEAGLKAPTLSGHITIARKIHGLDFMQLIREHLEMNQVELRNICKSPTQPAMNCVVAALILEAIYGDGMIQAQKILLDRIAGPIVKKIQITDGRVYDLDNMNPQQRKDLLEHLDSIRRKPVAPK